MLISPADFDWIRSFVHLRTGVVLDDKQAYLVQNRLDSLVLRNQYPSLEYLLYRVRHAADFPLRQQIIEAMLTHETYFFRDSQPFELLARQLLPMYMARRVQPRRVSIWSAACSTGQELYSIAMLLKERGGAVASHHFELVGTDVSSRVVARASRGEYSSVEMSRGLSPGRIQAHFQRSGDGYTIDPSLRKAVEFREQNLIAPWPPQQPYDIVFLRNVLIYFDIPTKRALLHKLKTVLRPDGALILGGSETLLNLDAPFDRVECAEGVYYQPSGK